MSAASRRLACLALASLMMSFAPILMSGEGEGAILTDYLIYEEDFEGTIPSFWQGGDDDPGSGSDSWGVSAYRSYRGDRSAWCAWYGSNHNNLLLNTFLHYYDEDMAAYMRAPLGDVSGYDTLSLRFHFWAETGTLNLNDHFDVRYWSGTSWVQIYDQEEPESDGWRYVDLEDIPNTAEFISFNFFSDGTVGSGPYEGVYIDDIRLYGLDTTQPASQVVDAPAYSRATTVHLPVMASDVGGSGVDHYTIRYRLVGSPTYSLYKPAENPSGHWTNDSVPFDAMQLAGEGVYQILSLAQDNSGLSESYPATPDVTIAIDRTPPRTNATVQEVAGDMGWEGHYNRQVNVTLASQDSVSGVESVRFSLDGGAWGSYADDTIAVWVSAEGAHEISYYAVDRAGNEESPRTFEFVIDREGPAVSLTSHQVVEANRTMLLSWACEGDGAVVHHFEVSVDDGEARYYGPGSRHGRISLPTGSHMVHLRAYDLAGNVDEVSVSYSLASDAPEGEEGAEAGFPSWAILAAGAIAGIAIVGIALWARAGRKG